MLRRDLPHELFSRELQALGELFLREPEDQAQWAKRESTRTKRTESNRNTNSGAIQRKQGFVTQIAQ